MFRVERPRPTTPIEPSRLQQLLKSAAQQESISAAANAKQQQQERLRIKLPATHMSEQEEGRQRSPRRPVAEAAERLYINIITILLYYLNFILQLVRIC